MKLLRRMNKSNNRKNSGFTLVELVIVMAIMGILGLAVVGFIGTSTKQYKYASILLQNFPYLLSNITFL